MKEKIGDFLYSIYSPITKPIYFIIHKIDYKRQSEWRKYYSKKYKGNLKKDIYCKVCQSCGIDGCCDSWFMLKHHIKSRDMACLHLEEVMYNVELKYESYNRIMEKLWDCNNDNMSLKKFRDEINSELNKLEDEIEL